MLLLLCKPEGALSGSLWLLLLLLLLRLERRSGTVRLTCVDVHRWRCGHGHTAELWACCRLLRLLLLLLRRCCRWRWLLILHRWTLGHGRHLRSRCVRTVAVFNASRRWSWTINGIGCGAAISSIRAIRCHLGQRTLGAILNVLVLPERVLLHGRCHLAQCSHGIWRYLDLRPESQWRWLKALWSWRFSRRSRGTRGT